jgi:hypothetical protein
MREKFAGWLKGGQAPKGLEVADLQWSPRIRTYVHVVTEAMWEAFQAGAAYGHSIKGAAMFGRPEKGGQ